jgi:hypothetical protein
MHSGTDDGVWPFTSVPHTPRRPGRWQRFWAFLEDVCVRIGGAP